METIRIVCPHCGLSREMPAGRLPRVAVRATCPGCKGGFDFDPATVAAAAPPPEAAPSGPVAAPPPPLTDGGAAPPPSPPLRGSARPQGTPPPRRPSPAKREGLMGIGELLAQTWETFQKRFATLFILYLLTILMGALPALVGAGMGTLLALVLPGLRGAALVAGGVLGGIVAALGFCWGMGSIFAASLDDGLDVRRSLERARPLILPFLWVSFLSSFVIGGGYLLLIIPGIIFTVWFLLAPFVLLDSDSRGMMALLKSRAMVRGRWFDLFLRLVVIWACSALIGAIPFLGALLLLVAAPFIMLYQALLYRDLRRVAAPVGFDCSFGGLACWPAVALAGYLALPLLLVSIFGISALGQLKRVGRLGAPPPLPGVGAPAGEQGALPGGGEWRVIPIPSGGDVALPQPGAAPPPEASATTGAAEEPKPDNLHLFIYAVNCPGRVLANGVELKQVESSPDMQYNYNLSGDRLRFGHNSIEIEYAPLTVQGNMLKPQIHLKISTFGKERRVLGEWRIEEREAGRRSFDLEIPR